MLLSYENEKLKLVCEKMDAGISYEAGQKAMTSDGIITEAIVRKIAFYYGVSAAEFEDLLEDT